MKDPLWHLDSSFLNLAPREVLKNIIRDDLANYQDVATKFSDLVKLMDDAISLYVESLQAAYRKEKEWAKNNCTLCSIMMASSALNYIFLARHCIFLGYFPETYTLLRGHYERITRCLMFLVSEEASKKFICGGKITQSDVHKVISTIAQNEESEDVLNYFKSNYAHRSKHVHPNLVSLESRTGQSASDIVKKEIEPYFIFGGMMSDKIGQAVILALLSEVLLALSILKFTIIGESRSWDSNRKKIIETYTQLVNELKKSTNEP